jgi:ribosomal protein S18 acetylase RimI-like enzyme
LKLRAFETRDSTAVIELANKYALFGAPISEADLAIARSFPNGFIVAEDSGRIVGFVLGYIRDIPVHVLEHWGASNVGHVELLAVDPSHRNQGLATALLNELLRVFKLAGVDFVTLHCPAKAKEARHIYARLGFRVRAFEMSKRP